MVEPTATTASTASVKTNEAGRRRVSARRSPIIAAENAQTFVTVLTSSAQHGCSA
jgi:hypothetical protein